MNENFTGDDGRFLAAASRLEAVPLGLLLGVAVRELVLKYDVKLAHVVVLAEAVFVPAADLEQEALFAHDGQVEHRVPFGVQRLIDGWGGLFRFAKRQY